MPKISVIIPTYNCGEYILEAIASVLVQTYKDYEIVIVDDGSTDNTKEIIKSCINNNPDKIRYFFQENTGVSIARNRGIKEAKGEYIAWLDADDEFVPETLESYIKAISETGAEWYISDIFRIYDGKKEIKVSKIPEEQHFLNILKGCYIERAFFFTKKSLIDIGFYDETLLILEDWDLFIRMLKANKKFYYINKPLYIYKIRKNSLIKKNSGDVLYFGIKLLQKHHKPLADAGNKEIAKIYAERMWVFAGKYFHELKNIKKTIYCFKESLKYDFNYRKILKSIFFNLIQFKK